MLNDKLQEDILAKPKSIHYIDNEKFLKEMVIYKREYNEAKSKNKEIATLYDIADDLSYGSNHNYTLDHFEERKKIYKEENFDTAEYYVQLKT